MQEGCTDFVMRYRDPKPLRIISFASVMLVLAGLPVFVGVTRLAPDPAGQPPGIVSAYTSGLSALGGIGHFTTALAVLFGVWLFVNLRREVGRKYLMASSRRRRNLVEDARALGVVLGAAGLIIGSLAGLYAAMLHARPDLIPRLALPHLTGELGIGCLLGGALLYAAGRFGR
jgi:hypothetical protein